jgi:hypothetical protein
MYGGKKEYSFGIEVSEQVSFILIIGKENARDSLGILTVLRKT